MKAAIIIPARYASTRLPGKPLLTRTGKPLIQHVYENALQVKKAASVIVATDDNRIFDAVTGFGGKAVMTSTAHETGSARIAEAASAINADIIVNIQGDEPEIEPHHIERLIALQQTAGAFASTLACPFPADATAGPGSPEDPSAVKAILGAVISDDAYWARYFTRHQAVWPRDAMGRIERPQDYYLHIGVYAFSKASLMDFAAAPQGALEKIERLEQLRILERGGKIAIGLIPHAAPGIDTPEDYEAFVRRVGKGAA
ncbi:3-deoxy-manno-octulosonate cytidylyltransferase [Marinicaulis aureus]|uniref:3-deoxy-manno-octulosonate cytidylyltransferase n=1 Tax=Hyphococcus aureus TaxID=2666033 RepID=A0ABW1KUE4_9PROT